MCMDLHPMQVISSEARDCWNQGRGLDAYSLDLCYTSRKRFIPFIHTVYC